MQGTYSLTRVLQCCHSCSMEKDTNSTLSAARAEYTCVQTSHCSSLKASTDNGNHCRALAKLAEVCGMLHLLQHALAGVQLLGAHQRLNVVALEEVLHVNLLPNDDI